MTRTTRHNADGLLSDLRDAAAGRLVGDLPEEEEQKFEEANELVRELGNDNLLDYIGRQYRAWYRAWRNDERGPPCKCSNPACPLKNGRLPYEIRRRPSPFAQTSHPEAEDRLRNYLDGHPQAIVIDETVDDLEDKKFRAEDLLRSVLTADEEPEADSRRSRGDV